MHFAQFATSIVIGSLIVCSSGSAEDRSTSSSQRYTIHVPKEVKFGSVQPATVDAPATQPVKEDAESLVFMAETTSGLTIQFETRAGWARKQSLKLTVGDSQRGDWWANNIDAASESTHETVAEGTSVEASTLRAG